MTLSVPASRSHDSRDAVLRVLQSADLAEFEQLLASDPDAYCVVAEKVDQVGLDTAAAGGQTWGWIVGGSIESAIYVGANLIPIASTAQARYAFANKLSRLGRRCSAIVGHASEVLDLWQLLEPRWAPLRELRHEQPLMVIDAPSLIPGDPLVQRVQPEDLDILLPASIAMFEEEVGVSPIVGGSVAPYRARIGESIRRGRAYARFQGDEVIFKAEVGAVSTRSCQLQGVWVTPRLRGTGLATAGISAVVGAALQEHAPRVNLYANSHNSAALRSYARVGFRQTATFATVLF